MPDIVSREEMVEYVPWMMDLDYEILKYLWEHDQIMDDRFWAGARSTAKGVGAKRNYVSKRMNTLARAGLLEKDGTIYSLSQLGRDLMRGDVAGEDVPEPSDK